MVFLLMFCFFATKGESFVLSQTESCTDEPPPTHWAKNTCEENKEAGNCDKKWFSEYCAVTCDHCPKLARLRVEGTKIYDHNDNIWVGRGMNWGKHSNFDLYDANDAAKMQEVFVSDDGTPWINHIRVVFKMVRGTILNSNGDVIDYDVYDANEPENGFMTETSRTYIDNIVQWATSAEIWVTLTMTYNGGESPPDDTCHLFVSNTTWREEHQQMWQYLVQKYKDTPFIAWVEPWSEAKLDDCSAEESTEWMNELIEKIQEVDPNVPVALGTHYNSCQAPGHWYELDSDQVIYPINFWCPGVVGGDADAAYLVEDTCRAVYGGAGSLNRPCVPGCTDEEAGKKGDDALTTSNKTHYEILVQSALEKSAELNAPIWVDQWGCEDTKPNYLQWVEDVGPMFSSNDISTDWWSWKGECDMCVFVPPIDCNDWREHDYTSKSDCRTNSDRMVVKETITAALNDVLGQTPAEADLLSPLLIMQN